MRPTRIKGIIMKTKLFTLFLALAASVGTVFAQSGTCGANLTWNLTNGILTISGSGAMTDYNPGKAPWYSYSSSITSVTIGNNVTSIGDGAFYDCYELTRVTIPNSVTSIGNHAFYDCSKLTSVTIPNSVTSIGDGAFAYCTCLTSITIPNNVTSIGDGAFYNCSKLTSVTIGNSVTSIGEYAFYNCSKLTSVTIGNSVTSIGNYAFCECSGLTSVTIPNSVTSIGNCAFDGCSGLTSVTISDLTAWCNIDFSNASANPLTWAEHLYLKHYNFTKKEIVDLVIPNSVTSIGNYAFCDCSGLTSVTIPNSVTSIGNDAFHDCSGLTSVTIGNSVISIGYGAFYNCSGLTSITCNAVVPPTCGEYTFYNVNISIPVYVPAGTKKAYSNAQEWDDFTNIQEMGATGGIDQLSIEKSSNGKYIKEGQLFIQRGEEVFNAQGARVE